MGRLVGITQAAQAWSPDDWNASAKRHTWPFKISAMPEMDNFLRFLRMRSKCQKTIDTVVQGIAYLFSMLEFNGVDGAESQMVGGDKASIGYLCKLYNTGIMSHLLSLPILCTRYAWTHKVLLALKHFCAHLEIVCGQQRITEGEKGLRLLTKDLLEPLAQQTSRARQARKVEKETLDSEGLQNFASVDVTKNGIKDAMIDIWAIDQALRSGITPSYDLVYPATVAMVGIIFFGSPAGRPGEWASMQKQQVLDLISNKRCHIVVKEHNTKRVYGAIVQDGP